MTVITEGDGRMAALYDRAAKKGGPAFADALRDSIEEIRGIFRQQVRGVFPPVAVAKEREQANKIVTAARELQDSMWVRVIRGTDGSTLAQKADRETVDLRPATLFVTRKALLVQLDESLRQVIDLATQHLAALPATRTRDYVRQACVTQLRSVFEAYNVVWSATISRNESGTRRKYPSLAVAAVMLAIPKTVEQGKPLEPLDSEAAKRLIRDHDKAAADRT